MILQKNDKIRIYFLRIAHFFPYVFAILWYRYFFEKVHPYLNFWSREIVCLSQFRNVLVHECESNWRPILWLLWDMILLKSLIIMARKVRFRPNRFPIYVSLFPNNEFFKGTNLLWKVKQMKSGKRPTFFWHTLYIYFPSQKRDAWLLIVGYFQVEVNEKAVRQLYIENTGKFNVDFAWELKQPQKPRGRKDAWAKDKPPVSITPYSGEVQCNVRRRCQLSFCPPFQMELKDCEVLLKVCLTPHERLQMSAFAKNAWVCFHFHLNESIMQL